MSSDLPPPQEIQTDRLHLRPLRGEDRPEYIRSHEESIDFWKPWMPARVEGETVLDLFAKQLEQTQEGWRDGSQYRFIAWWGDRIAAYVSLTSIVRGAFHCAYAGWRTGKPFTRQGIATEAVTGLLDFAFARPPFGVGLHRVQANIIPTNASSLKVAEKCGFRREGLALRYLCIDGEWRDHVMTAKLVDEHRFRYLTGVRGQQG